MVDLCHQTKTLINFWYKRELNPKSLIQPSKILLIELTLPIDLTRTHLFYTTWKTKTSLPVNFALF